MNRLSTEKPNSEHHDENSTNTTGVIIGNRVGWVAVRGRPRGEKKAAGQRPTDYYNSSYDMGRGGAHEPVAVADLIQSLNSSGALSLHRLLRPTLACMLSYAGFNNGVVVGRYFSLSRIPTTAVPLNQALLRDACRRPTARWHPGWVV